MLARLLLVLGAALLLACGQASRMSSDRDPNLPRSQDESTDHTSAESEQAEDGPGNGAATEDEPESQASNEAGTGEPGEQTGQAGEGGNPIDHSGEGGVPDEQHPAPDATRVTYHRDIRALIERSCISCHVEGGIGPMPLDDFASVSEFGPLVVLAVGTRIMPPWPASDDCRDLRDVRRLSDGDVALFEAWRDDGFVEGDPAEYVRPTAMSVGVPDRAADLILMPAESYLPSTVLTDEYRCFLAEGAFDVDTYLTGMDIRPGVREQVHHVQVHKISASELDGVHALDDAAEGAGYPCGGGAGFGITSVNMFSWRPGAGAILFEDGDAALVEAGSAFVLQVHYNSQHLPEGGPLPDRSGVAFWTLPSGELPQRVVIRKGVYGSVGPSGVIPAGNAHVVGETTIAMSQLSTVDGAYVQGEIVGMTPHMHMLGTRLSATLLRAGGDECMIDVPDWDFEWQLDYAYAEPTSYDRADELTVRCEYDNSAANQPLIDGLPIAPRDVTWGEGSLDEMCLNYVWFRYERSAFLAATR
jgi:Copper type II ascorbate-dependent monooxygenase, C-terminal domain